MTPGRTSWCVTSPGYSMSSPRIWRTLRTLSSQASTPRQTRRRLPTTAELEARKKAERKRKIKRYLLIGLATTVGGTLLGVTGGLAAPLVAAGAGAVIGGAGAAVLGSTAGIAVMTSLFGAAGAGLTGYKMKKRVGQVEEFEFVTLTEGRKLDVTIAITGWLSSGKYGSFETPWRCLHHSREQYCLVWESQYLRGLGRAIDSIINGLLSMAAQEALKLTVLSGILAALAWPSSLLLAANIIDNPWDVCLNRAAETGKQLARVLLSRQQGKRPVTLIGFSLGARVIFYCLEEMAKEKGCEGIVEDAVLLGAPVQSSAKRWDPIARVVSGRITNGYCRGDWLLKFLYRSSSVQLNVAGLQPVCTDSRQINNVDLSAVVNGHMDYMKEMETVLRAVGIRTRGEAVVTAQSLGGMLASGCSDQPPTDQPPTDQPPTDQPLTDQPLTDQPLTDQPLTNQPPTDQPATDQSPPDEPPTDQPPTDQPLTDQPPTDQPPTDQPPTDQPPTDQPPIAQPPADEPPTDQPPAVEASSDAPPHSWLDGDESEPQATLATDGRDADREDAGGRPAAAAAEDRGAASNGGSPAGQPPDEQAVRVEETGTETTGSALAASGGSASGRPPGGDDGGEAASGQADRAGRMGRGSSLDAPDILGAFDATHFGVGRPAGVASGGRVPETTTPVAAAVEVTDCRSREQRAKMAHGVTDENFNKSD
uniref:Transmembrane and coiled-coil domain-containing protein 4 isoform X2 n=1 Tax=Petromyzon marinus TaxID=7757 RepID=A0AAJ7TX39_PETMA|nr:transmembrane and coiled-coil domain-containing protein 4 isoform X2 [Petromyzon marinus]